MAFGMNFFRRHRGKLLIFLAVFLMVMWFVGGPLLRMLQPQQSAGIMYGQRVSRTDYENARMVMTVTRGENASEEDIWTFLVLQHEADRLGIQVSGEEVSEQLKNWMAQQGAQTPEQINSSYMSFLRRVNLSDEAARFAVMQWLRVQKLRSMVAGAGMPTDAAMWQAYVRVAVKLKLKTLEVPFSAFAAEVAKPTEEELAAWYETNKEQYRVPEKMTIQYAFAAKKDYANLFAVDDAKIQSYYELNRDELYLLPPQEELESTAAVESTAAAPMASAESTAAAVESTAAAESPEALYKPLSEVRDQIVATLLDQEAEGVMNGIVIDLGTEPDVTLEERAKRAGLPYFQIGPISQEEFERAGGLADAAADNQSVAQALFPVPPERYEIAKSPDGIYIFRGGDIAESYLPALADVRDKVEADYIADAESKLALAAAKDALATLAASGWAAVTPGDKYAIAETDLATDPSFEALNEDASLKAQGAFGGPVLSDAAAWDYQVVERELPGYQEYETYRTLALMGYNFPGMPEWVARWQQRIYEDRLSLVQDWEKDLVARANVERIASSGQAQPIDTSDLGY